VDEESVESILDIGGIRPGVTVAFDQDCETSELDSDSDPDFDPFEEGLVGLDTGLEDSEESEYWDGNGYTGQSEDETSEESLEEDNEEGHADNVDWDIFQRLAFQRLAVRDGRFEEDFVVQHSATFVLHNEILHILRTLFMDIPSIDDIPTSKEDAYDALNKLRLMLQFEAAEEEYEEFKTLIATSLEALDECLEKRDMFEDLWSLVDQKAFGKPPLQSQIDGDVVPLQSQIDGDVVPDGYTSLMVRMHESLLQLESLFQGVQAIKAGLTMEHGPDALEKEAQNCLLVGVDIIWDRLLHHCQACAIGPFSEPARAVGEIGGPKAEEEV